jgi:predicted NUDIX family NTP pyrophosphohydrolase
MSRSVSAGLLMYRFKNDEVEIFLAHPGGPLFRNKDDGYWTIPKGIIPDGETLMDAAIREFVEETGVTPAGPYIELGSIRQRGGKVVHAWAFEGRHDSCEFISSNLFEMEWPPKSGRIQSFPEVDRAEFFSLIEGKKKLKDTQWPLVERLIGCLRHTNKSD